MPVLLICRSSRTEQLEVWNPMWLTGSPGTMAIKNKIAQSCDPMPRPTPCTTPNHSSDSSPTLTQLRRKLPIVCPSFAPKISSSCGQISKPNYLPHPCIYPIYRPKPHPYPISHFATMHWTNRQTDQQIVGGNVQ